MKKDCNNKIVLQISVINILCGAANQFFDEEYLLYNYQ